MLGGQSSHAVLGESMTPPFPPGTRCAIFAMGCFWGAERIFWNLDGVVSTAVGYCGGGRVDPTYREVCSGTTGHAESVLVVFDPTNISYEQLLVTFWENHDPTTYMRQGNDVGPQYRSALFTIGSDQLRAASTSAKNFQDALTTAGMGSITTEITPSTTFYYAESYHQQYLAKNPSGYCGLVATGVSCPTPTSARPPRAAPN